MNFMRFSSGKISYTRNVLKDNVNINLLEPEFYI